ncbi:helix-turn-helix domain-containing protein [Falsigemmobacter intermedius]|uniref:helix-turn-helix domain-containing protein n=1 Tax=Falsigemmobacter intermedius TaxID=1553448 RepID=UPI003F02DC55
MASGDSVRALRRGIEILRLINAEPGLRESDIAKRTAIPRPTVYRLMETLEELHLVTRSPSDERWRPTVHTRALTSGYRDDGGISAAALPHMTRLGRQILWPIDLVSFHDYAMLVRESTHNSSPFSIDVGMAGRLLPVTETAGGRAWLAWCPEEERDMILAGIEARSKEAGGMNFDRRAFGHILDRVRHLGLGFRVEGFRNHTMSLSAPIRAEGRILACLTIVWIASALDFETALDRYRGPLLETVAAIEADLAA